MTDERLAELGRRAVNPLAYHDSSLVDAVPELVAEVRRLRGVIAAHDLCHDLHGKVGPREFADGCAAEQRKLYGVAPDADEVARLRAAVAVPPGSDYYGDLS